MVGRSRYSLPLSPSLAQKFDTLSAELDVRVLASAGGGAAATDSRFHLVGPVRPRALDGLAFYALLPFRVARELRSFRPDAVLAQGAQEAALAVLGRRLARVQTRVIADIHGDPAAPTRLYGSPSRRALAPLADALAGYGLRRSRRRADDLRVHVEARARGGGRADRRVRGVHGPRAVHGGRARAAPGRDRSRSSSACSSATRRSTCSPMRGGARRRACPTRRSTSSAAGRCTRCPSGSSPTSRSRRAGPSRSRRPRSPARSTRRRFSCSRRARRGSAASSSRRSAGAAGSSRAGSAASPTSSTTDAPACSSRRATPTRSPTRSSACSPIAPSRERLGAAAHERGASRGSRRRRSTPRRLARARRRGRRRARLDSRDAARTARSSS